MFWTMRYHRGRLAAAVVGLCAGIGCATTGPQAGKPDQLALTPAEDRHAAALAHYATAVSLATTKGISAALPEFKLARELDPGNLAVAFLLAEYYRSQQDTTNAIAVLDTAIAANPNSAEPLVAKGLTYRVAYDATNAITAFRQALKVEPTHAGALRALTESYLIMDDTNNVVSLLNESFRQHSTDALYWTMLGDLSGIALQQKPSLAGRLKPTQAKQCYERALELAPKNPDILLRVGDAYLNANEFKAAAETFAKLLDLRPNLPQLRERLAAVYLKLDQKEKAIALYKDLIKHEPLRFEFYNALGELYEDVGKLDDALNFFEQSLKLNPDQSDIYVAICEVQRRLKRSADATKTLAAWKKRFPVDWRVSYIQAFIHSGNKDYTKAVAAYADAETLAREAPQEVKLNAQFYFSYAAACERAGDLDKATALFRKVITADSKFANAYNYLGYMWADKGTNLTEAVELIQKAVTLEPDNGAFLDSLGWAFHKLGRDAEALPQLRRAVELLEKDTKRDQEDKQDDAVVYDHLADVLIKLNKRADAIAVWKRAIKLDPGNKDIAAKLAAAQK